MADLTLDLSEETPILGEKTRESFVFNSDVDTNSISNVMLIDSNVLESQIFYDSANFNTFPIIYSYDSGRDELLQLLQNKFTSLERISFVFHDSINGKTFLNNELFFLETDIDPENLSLSPNVEFLLKIITDFAVKNIDFLQCNSLNHPNWVKYYDVLNKNTNVIVGGSSDETGNLQYGGNWIMENTTEDIQNVYLTSYISNYTSTLVDIGSNFLYIKQNTTTKVVSYSLTDSNVVSNKVDISSNGWPVTIRNTNPTTPLNVIFTTDILVDGSNSTMQFEASSNFINFDGSWNNTRNTIRIRNITGYRGFFKNGGATIKSNGFNNVAIKNFIVDVSGTTLDGTNLSGSLSNFNANNLDYGLNGFLTARYYGMGGDLTGGNHTYLASKDLSGNLIDNCSFRGLTFGGNLDTNFSLYRFIGDYTSRHSSMTISNCDMSGVKCYMVGDAFGSGVSNATNFFSKGKPTITDCSSNTGAPILGKFSGSYLDPTGASGGGLFITNFSNTGNIIGGGSIGSDISNQGRLVVVGCSNTGLINTSMFGGFLGSSIPNFGSIYMNKCRNSGNISGGASGGFIGRLGLNALKYESTIENCYNTGTIGLEYSNYGGNGGILGAFVTSDSDVSLNLINCYNAGTILGYISDVPAVNGLSNSRSGGLIGGNSNPYGRYILKNCYNIGTINGYGAGLIGGNLNGVVILNNCYNAGQIVGLGSAFITDAFTYANSASYKSSITLNNCYNVGKYATDLSGVFIRQTRYDNNLTNANIITITNCYDTGCSIDGKKAPFVGPPIINNTVGNTFKVDINNCYSISTPLYGTDMSRNFVDSSNNITIKTVTNCYMSPTWSDTSANAALLAGTFPFSDVSNNPGSVWAEISSVPNTPYILSSFKSPIYDSSNINITNGLVNRFEDKFPSGHNGLFDSSNNAPFTTKDFSYNLVSKFNSDVSLNNLSNISVDASGALIINPHTRKIPTNDIVNVFVAKFDTSSNNRPYNYSFNQNTIKYSYATDISLNADVSANVYIKQDSSTNAITYSTNTDFTTPIPLSVWPVTVRNSSTTKPLNVIFMGDNSNNILVDPSNPYIQFEASSNFINFDGSYNSARRSQIQIRDVTGYGGFFKNGGTSIKSNGFNNVAIRNFIVDVSNTSLGGNAKNLNSVITSGVLTAAEPNFNSNTENNGRHGFLTARYYGMGGDVSGSNHFYNAAKDFSLNTISNCSFRGFTSGNYSSTLFDSHRFIGDYTSRHSSMTISGCDMSGVRSYFIGEAFGSGVSNNTNLFSKGKPTVRDCFSNSGTPLLGRFSGSYVDASGASGGGLYINNFSNSGAIIGGGGGSIGRMLGLSGRLIIENCSNTGQNNSYQSGCFLGNDPGGAIGSLVMNNCWNRGQLMASNSYGGTYGLIGRSGLQQIQYDSYINNCYNTGEILNDNTQHSAGLFPASILTSWINSNTQFDSKSLYVTNCYNSGTVNGGFCGGLIANGSSNNTTGIIVLNNCYNIGTIIGTASGFCGNQIGGNIIMNNCFNAGNITGNGRAFIANTTTTGDGNFPTNITLNNCYNVGRYTNDLSGVFLGETRFNGQTNKINMKNCYDVGAIGGAHKAPFIGPGTTFYTADISNCYSISTPFYGPTDMSINFINNPSVTGKNVTNCYMGQTWSDASVTNLLGRPTDLYTNNPGTIWTKLNTGITTPYILSSFKSPIYGPSNETINTGSVYKSSAGLFPSGHNGLFDSSNNADFRTKDFSYNLVSVNDKDVILNNITVDLSGGRVNVPNTKRLTSDMCDVFVFKSDVSSNNMPYNYNFNTYTVRNSLVTDISLNADVSANVYIKQDSSTKSLTYSTNTDFTTPSPLSVWPVTVRNSSTTKPLNVIFMGDNSNNILVDPSNQYIQFEASSNFINFDGSYNSARRSQIQIRDVTGYGGFFKNGGTSIKSNGFNNVAIRNFIVDVSNTSLGGLSIPGIDSSNVMTNFQKNDIDYGFNGFLTARYYGMGGDLSANHTYLASKDLSGNRIENCSFRGTTSSSDVSFSNFRFIGDYASRHSSMTISGCDMSGVKSYMIGDAFGSGASISGSSTDNNTRLLSKGKTTVRDCSSNTGTPLLGRFSGSYIDFTDASGAGLYITNFSNTGTLVNPTGFGVGGGSIGGNCGQYGRLFIENCWNTGDISGTSLGGLLSCKDLEFVVGSISVNKCWNSGKISGTQSGGLFSNVGFRDIERESYITNCYNSGEISGTACGGLGGPAISRFATVNLNIENCYNFGNITNTNTTINLTSGGFFGGNGGAHGYFKLTNCYNLGTISNSNAGFFGQNCNGLFSMNNCFNAGNITGNGSAFIANTWNALTGTGLHYSYITLNNCYNTGIYNTDLSGIFINRTNYLRNNPINSTISINNCYDVGAANGAKRAPFVGPPVAGANDPTGNNYKVDISNCYSISTPITNGYIDMSRNFVDSSNNITLKTVSNVYMGPTWSDASATNLLGRPTGLNDLIPGTIWAKFNSSANRPYILSSFKSPVYDPSNITINQPTLYTSNKGLFPRDHNGLFDSSNNADFRTKDFSYNLVSINNNIPSTYTNIDGSNSITIDASGGLKFSNQLPPKIPYVTNVFVSKSDASSNLLPYNYNLNTFTYENDYSDTIRNNGNVYIKQNADNKIQYSLNNTTWTDISSGNASNGNVTISSYDPSSTNILNVSITTPITLSADNSCNFVVKSNYITFDGSYNNLTFNNLTNYGGFIQNGTDASDGYYGVKVQNFITDRSGTSTLYSNDMSNNPDADGWLLGSYFGKNSKSVTGFDKNRVADAISIKNITNKAPVTSNYAGGIGGSNFGLNSYATIENCSNSGDISGNYAGGICGSRVAANSGEVTITKTFNIAPISGQSSGGLCGTSSGLPSANAADPSSNLIIRNSYSTGHINGANAGGICGSNTGYTSGNNVGKSNILIENSYSLGDVKTNNGGKIIGGNDLSAAPIFDSSYSVQIDISNCYGYGSDVSSNPNLYGQSFLQLSQSSLGKLTVNQTKWYNAFKNKWLDVSAAQDDGIDGPENLYNNNPGSVWTSVKKNTPYVLATFNSSIYNPNNVLYNESEDYKNIFGLFSYKDYSYNLITVNDSDPSYSDVYVDTSGSLTFPSSLKRNKRYNAEVFVSKGVAPYYTNYNYNNFTFENQSYTIDTSGTVYVKQDASSNIVFSDDQGRTWTQLNGNVTIYNSGWEDGTVLNVLFKSDITVDNSGNSVVYDISNGVILSTENFSFTVKSSYITFDGANKNITFKNQTGYKGLIQNGDPSYNGYYGIIVKNFNTKFQSSLDSGFLYSNYDNLTKRSVDPNAAGWLIGSYFGKNSKTRFEEDGWNLDYFDLSKDVVSVRNIRNTAVIQSHYAGGICGSYFGSGNSYATIISCSNSGDLANTSNNYNGCGGICGAGVGSYGGTVKIYNCNNDGNIYTFNGGGICGSKVADGSGNVLISSCYSVSDIKGKNAGGICGQSVACGNSTVNIQNCYSIGNIIGDSENGNAAGGICGADAGYKLTYPATATLLDGATGVLINSSTLNIENCYAIGDIIMTNGSDGGKLIGGFNIGDKPISSQDSTTATINIKKCFTNDSTNSDSGYTSNNIVGTSFTNFLNDNKNTYDTDQKYIIFNKKTFMVDIFNNQNI